MISIMSIGVMDTNELHEDILLRQIYKLLPTYLPISISTCPVNRTNETRSARILQWNKQPEEMM